MFKRDRTIVIFIPQFKSLESEGTPNLNTLPTYKDSSSIEQYMIKYWRRATYDNEKIFYFSSDFNYINKEIFFRVMFGKTPILKPELVKIVDYDLVEKYKDKRNQDKDSQQNLENQRKEFVSNWMKKK